MTAYYFLSQRVFEENRNAEVVEMQRLEEQERRRREEKVSQLHMHMSSIILLCT